MLIIASRQQATYPANWPRWGQYKDVSTDQYGPTAWGADVCQKCPSGTRLVFAISSSWFSHSHKASARMSQECLLGGCSERTGHSPAQLSISSQISRLKIARAEDLDRWLIPQRRWMFWQFASRARSHSLPRAKNRNVRLQPKFYSSSTNKLPELVLATGSQFQGNHLLHTSISKGG
ncbi:hypothetical protein I7I50_01423 [Histoplasma capsulatum G186AR]|uniref:Uncharacterized protein n=1 Tax=Ajellomyces capsulatus TaxID=5037 RepID=A0A8H8CSC9_AJECA|nr:hypothetical protein I7I52_12539 [Histoplasma capsulatum]QSS73304.1 hypothetical protein I7I50_01423 [Histoplasma capsulatum G186AR]